ncbi:MAG: extracellular solute-binding protein [Clostridium sp.]
MKKYKFSIFTVIIVCILVIGAIISLFYGNDKEVKGEINILASAESYEYLVESANLFMEKNKKSKINVNKAYDNEYASKAKEAITSDMDIVQLDSVLMYKLNSLEENFSDNKEIIETYKNNFTLGRIKEVIFSDEVKGVPLTSRPLVLYIREDMIKEYGYSYVDLNTWNDVIRIGEDIHLKSNGKVKLINATGRDMEDLYSLLIMQELEKGEKDIEKIVSEVSNFILMLNEKNIINLVDGGEFAVRISSANGMRELAAIKEKCEWVATYPPSKIQGSNKFYVAEGSNLVIVTVDKEKDELVEAFLSYLTTNTEVAIKYAKKGEFFPSYLYTYKDKSIEDNINNFIVRSPLIIMDNIIQKAPEIKDYEIYREAKSKFTNN